MLSFEEIDKRRVAAGLTRKAVYERAKVDGETWRRLANKRTEPNTKTLRKLTTALEELTAQQAGQ
jgi:predicted transcriptional regulator